MDAVNKEDNLQIRTNQSEHRPSGSAQWESARPNLDLPKIEARSEVSA